MKQKITPMKKTACFFLTLLLLLATDLPLKAQIFTDRVFVHVFNLNIGGLTSTTELVIHYPSNAGVSGFVSAQCGDENGGRVGGIFGEILDPDETITLPVPIPITSSSEGTTGVPEDFIGYCVVRAETISATANWKIQVASGADVNTSVVGQALYQREQAASDWALPVGQISQGSLLGVAIYNSSSETTCTVRAVDGSGAAVAGLDQVEITIPSLGQVARFPFNSQDLVGKTVSLRVTCGSDVIPLAVVQDAANGFPTPSYGFPLP